MAQYVHPPHHLVPLSLRRRGMVPSPVGENFGIGREQVLLRWRSPRRGRWSCQPHTVPSLLTQSRAPLSRGELYPDSEYCFHYTHRPTPCLQERKLIPPSRLCRHPPRGGEFKSQPSPYILPHWGSGATRRGGVFWFICFVERMEQYFFTPPRRAFAIATATPPRPRRGIFRW